MKAMIVVALVAAFVLAPAGWSQMVTIGTGTLQNSTTSYPTPYGNYYKGSHLQCIVQASELTAACMTPMASITSIGWDVVTAGGGPLQIFEIKIGHTTATDLSSGWDLSALTPAFGPTTYQDVVGWNDHALTTPFVWNGTDSLLIDVCFWNGSASSYTTNAVVNTTETPFVSSLTYRSDSTDPFLAWPGTAPIYSDSERPNIRFGVGSVVPPLYQMNSPEASLDINGSQGTSCSPTIVTQSAYLCGTVADPVTGTFNISTMGAPGVVYEIVMDTSGLVPVGGGGVPLLGEILNLNPASPNWTYLNGGTTLSVKPFPGMTLPGVLGGTASFPYSINTQLDLSTQGVFIAPVFPTGLKLTQATEFHVNVLPPVASIPGPTALSTNIEVDVTSGATCWAPGGVPFFGTSYTTIYVAPNGTICFGGGGDTDGSPSLFDAINDDGRVGFWTDLDPSEGGVVNILNPGLDIIRVEYIGVFYNGGGPGVTYAIEIDCNTGAILIDGLAGLVANPNTSSTLDDQWLGISPGLTLATTDPGGQPFSVGGTGAAVLPTDMLYEFNDVSVSLVGLPASVAGGLNQLLFTPDGLGNYAWSGF